MTLATTPAGKPHHRMLVVVGDASETLDTLYPYYRLQEAGFEPVVAGSRIARPMARPQ
jgi:protease I